MSKVKRGTLYRRKKVWGEKHEHLIDKMLRNKPKVVYVLSDVELENGTILPLGIYKLNAKDEYEISEDE